MKPVAFYCLLSVVAVTARAADCSKGTGDAQQCLDAARECASIESDAERLACFDGVYASDSMSERPVDDGEQRTPVELTASPEDFAGRSVERPRSERIETTIVGITTNAHNIDFLTLANGHTWRENEDSRVRFRTGSKVTIEEGMFGSFNLTMEGAPRPVKVKRVE